MNKKEINYDFISKDSLSDLFIEILSLNHISKKVLLSTEMLPVLKFGLFLNKKIKEDKKSLINIELLLKTEKFLGLKINNVEDIQMNKFYITVYKSSILNHYDFLELDNPLMIEVTLEKEKNIIKLKSNNVTSVL